MAQEDKQHKKKLKEAQKTYNKYFKAFKQGKISKDELKEKLRPYKYELKELGYPVKIKDDDRPQEKDDQEEKKAQETKVEKIPVAYKPWNKRSSLTTEEIERNIDILSIGGSSSEKLRTIYKSKYGEELPPPEDLVPFEQGQDVLPKRRTPKALPSVSEEEEEDEEGSDLVAGEKRSFWKSIFKEKKETATEQ